METKFTELTFDEREKLLSLPKSTWKESDTYWKRDIRRTEVQTNLAKDLINYAFTGNTNNITEEYAKKIMSTLQDKEDRLNLAKELISWENYTEFTPDYNDLGQDDKLEKELISVKEKYDGLDAFVEAAQLEFAENLAKNYADVEELIKLFK